MSYLNKIYIDDHLNRYIIDRIKTLCTFIKEPFVTKKKYKFSEVTQEGIFIKLKFRI